MKLLENILGPNTQPRMWAIVLLIAYLILRFPVIVAGLPLDIQNAIFTVANETIHLGIAAALWFVKQHNVGGTGAGLNDFTKPASDGMERVVSILVIGSMSMLFLTGCGTADTAFRKKVERVDVGGKVIYDADTKNYGGAGKVSVYFRDPSAGQP